MTDAQLNLFIATPANTTVPICLPCGEPLGWNPRTQRWNRYCGGSQCVNPIRLCKHCTQPYPRDTGGTRYCSPVCRDAWQTARYKTKTDHGPCAHCGATRGGFNYWDLCGNCYRQLEVVAHQLRKHHVPIHIVSRLLTDPTCFNPGCDINLLEIYADSTLGRPRARLVVDHDHRHCAGSVSCGICVRGLLCSPCNTTLGILNENTVRIAGLVDYYNSTM